MRSSLLGPVVFALVAGSLAGLTAEAQVVINELLASHTGADTTEYVELYGPPGTSLAGLSFVVVEGDALGAGTIDRRIDFGPEDRIGANGFFLIGNPAGLGPNYGVTPNLTIGQDFFENSSLTAALVSSASLAGGSVTGSEVVHDAVGLTDGGAGDRFFFGAPVIGPDGTFFPAGARRVADGVDTDTVDDWLLAAFSLGDANTPTAGTFAPPTATCSDPITPIGEIQGPGLASPYVGEIRAVRGIVVGDFQGPSGMLGFFVQEEAADQDAEPETSEGIFVFDPATTVDVAPGDVVRVAGTVSEVNGQTRISSVTSVLDCGDAPRPAPVPVTLPETVDGDLERYEGMLVQVVTTTGRMTVAQGYFLGRYGQLTLASPDGAGAEGRLYQPTDQHRPLTPDALALAGDNARRLLVLDDGFEVAPLGDNPDPVPYLGSPPPAVLRAGDAVENLVGVLDQGRINASSPPAVDYRLQPTESPVFLAGNPRTATPDDQGAVGGRLRVASFNVLNYFATIDQPGAVCFGPDVTTPRNNCRGADSASELARQRDKLVAALAAIDADVVGLIELENNFGTGAAIADLVAALNAVPGGDTYAYVDPGVAHIGSDAIAQGFLYKPATVGPIGGLAVLDSTFDPAFVDVLNRPVLAQTFEEVGTGERFTVAVNHLKSKGSDCDAFGDPNQGDGQGNCNRTRTAAAKVLAEWLATDPTGSGDPDFLVIGDLNAYAREDPVVALEEAGYRDQLRRFGGQGGYTYIFDGLSGALDHALANVSLSGQVTGVAGWHINTDEPAVIDYDESFNPAGYYRVDPYRSSDHDPVVVGLALGAPSLVSGTPRRDVLSGTPGYDRITGGPGGDALTGGAGVDVYVYGSLRDGGDTITDFEVGVDAIDLRPLLAALGTGGDPFGTGVVHVHAGRGGDATVSVDPDGSAGPGRGVPMVRLPGLDPATVPVTTLLVLP
jgi:hypothetical protein